MNKHLDLVPWAQVHTFLIFINVLDTVFFCINPRNQESMHLGMENDVNFPFRKICQVICHDWSCMVPCVTLQGAPIPLVCTKQFTNSINLTRLLRQFQNGVNLWPFSGSAIPILHPVVHSQCPGLWFDPAEKRSSSAGRVASLKIGVVRLNCTGTKIFQ